MCVHNECRRAAEMETVRRCILQRIGIENPKPKFYNLEDKTEAIIGRSLDATFCIASTHVSRKHAILKKVDNTWSVTDNNSLNGIIVNDQKLNPGEPHELKDGDVVQIGTPPGGTSSEFVWKFHKAMKMKVRITANHMKTNSETTTGDLNTNEKRKLEEPQPSTSWATNTTPTKKPALKRVGECSQARWAPSEEIKKKLAEQERLAEEKIKEQEKKLEEMQALLKEKEKMQEQMLEELQRKEKEMKEEMELQQAAIEIERQQFEENMKKNFENELKVKEESLLSKLRTEKERLIGEKIQVEENLKNQFQHELEEKDHTLKASLMKEKEKLEKIIYQRETEQKLLESQLNETKSENLKQKQDVLQVKENLLASFAELMETELQCSICNELFVEATSLNCSHSFCSMCITEWMKVKNECPNCRAKITSHLRSRVLDSYIDKMVEHFSEDMKEGRKQLLKERDDEKKRKEEEKRQKEESQRDLRGGRGRNGRSRRGRVHNDRGGRNDRGRGRGGVGRDRGRGSRGGSSGSARGRADSPGPQRPSTSRGGLRNPVVVDSDSDSSSQSSIFTAEDSDSDSYDEGIGGEYYGGYGHCFRCGRRGHWANGCPY